MQTVNRRRHDVVVVGARVAGAATAMLLARLGHDVVVDQAWLPSDTVSTHSIARSGVVQLRRWGLLDQVLDSGAPAIRQVTFHGPSPSTRPSAPTSTRPPRWRATSSSATRHCGRSSSSLPVTIQVDTP